MRVMSRITSDFGDIGALATKNRLREAAQRCLPGNAAGDTNQALMELGATICLPRDPRCLLCPVASFCKARAEGVQDQLPTKLRRPATIAVETTLLRIEREDCILLRQRPIDDRMAGFWELPEPDDLPRAEWQEELHRFRHSIMNRAYRCTVRRATLPSGGDPLPLGLEWIEFPRLGSLPLSTMARKSLRLKMAMR
ncbi:MAG: NUDIX domain-containing protein [Bryobacterales bacterium]|nr:NUDIX domain-containing protein [Bryobacterales bacterium]